MGKLAGIKGKSPDAYPPDNLGQPTISTQSVVNSNFVDIPTNNASPPASLLPAGPIQAGGAQERIIVMFSGQLQWPNASEIPGNSTIGVGIYLDGSLVYSIIAFVASSSTVRPDLPIAPVPFSLFWETPANGIHTVDIKAKGTLGAAVGANGSLVLITTPV